MTGILSWVLMVMYASVGTFHWCRQVLDGLLSWKVVQGIPEAQVIYLEIKCHDLTAD